MLDVGQRMLCRLILSFGITCAPNQQLKNCCAVYVKNEVTGNGKCNINACWNWNYERYLGFNELFIYFGMDQILFNTFGF